MAVWYIHRDGKKTGPYTPSEMMEAASSGHLRITDHLSKNDETKLHPVAKVRGLSPSIQEGKATSLPTADGPTRPSTTLLLAMMACVLVSATVTGSLVWLIMYSNQSSKNPDSTLAISTAPANSEQAANNITATPDLNLDHAAELQSENSTSGSYTLAAHELYDSYSPATVAVLGYSGSWEPLSQGSGFFIDDAGTFVTNWHVIEGAQHIRIALSNGTYADANSIRVHSIDYDLAVVTTSIANSAYIGLSDQDASGGVGHNVFVLGAPHGLQNTLSSGIISGFQILDNGTSLIQTTAPASPGSSGGPLINQSGLVLGVLTSSLQQGQNINFAVPTNYIKDLLEQDPQI
jgi:S1-C subfamily serine protease